MLKKLEVSLAQNKLLAPVIIAAVVFFVFVFSLPNSFVLDDPSQVLNSQVIGFDIPQIFGGSSFGVAGTSTPAGRYYKPLMTVSYALLYKLFGSAPAAFHLFQLLIHMGSVILIYFLFKKFFRPTLSLFLALVMAIHPLNSEAVLYVSSLQDPLFFFFGLSALLIATKKILRPIDTILSVAFLALSLFSKESGVLFIPIIILYRLLCIQATPKKIGEFLVIFGVFLAFFIPIRFAAVGMSTSSDAPYPIMRLDLLHRVQNIPTIIFYYVRNFFFPYDFAVAQHWVISGVTITTFYLPLIIDLLVFLVFVGFAFILYRFKSTLFFPYIFFFLWFLLGMLPHLNLYPLDVTVADRWFYFASVGIIAMLGTIASTYKLDKRPFFAGVFCVLLLVLGMRTIIRSFDWRNGLILATHDINYSHDSFPLENNLAFELINVGRYDQALVHAQKSVELGPWWWLNWNNLGVIYRHKGYTQNPKYYKDAEKYFRRAAENGSSFYLPYENLTELLTNYDTPQNAQKFIIETSKKMPLSGRMFFDLAIVQLQLKDKKGALQAANQARLLLPQDQAVQKLYRAIKEGKTIQLQKAAY